MVRPSRLPVRVLHAFAASGLTHSKRSRVTLNQRALVGPSVVVQQVERGKASLQAATEPRKFARLMWVLCLSCGLHWSHSPSSLQGEPVPAKAGHDQFLDQTDPADEANCVASTQQALVGRESANLRTYWIANMSRGTWLPSRPPPS